MMTSLQTVAKNKKSQILRCLAVAATALFLGPNLALSEESSFVSPGPVEQPSSFRQADFSSCITCHGSGLKGNYATRAPALNQLPSWYVKRQLESFTTAYRGKGDSDHYSVAMYRMAMSLDQDKIEQAIDFVASWHAGDAQNTFKPNEELTSHTDPLIEAGKAVYSSSCADCHGSEGEGNQDMAAPPLAAMDPWYIEKQVRKFKSGQRGKAEADIYGQMMSEAASGLSTEDIDALTTYLSAAIGDSK